MIIKIVLRKSDGNTSRANRLPLESGLSKLKLGGPIGIVIPTTIVPTNIQAELLARELKRWKKSKEIDMTETLPPINHDTEIDGAGWSGRDRLTCHRCNKTLIKQPYMNRQDWLEAVKDFAAAHPSSIITDYCDI